jgi:hypothetical protein
VIQEAYVQGVSTRSVDELVKAMGMVGQYSTPIDTLISVPPWNAPQLRAVTDRYAAQTCINLTPDMLDMSMGFSLVASTEPIFRRQFASCQALCCHRHAFSAVHGAAVQSSTQHRHHPAQRRLVKGRSSS